MSFITILSLNCIDDVDFNPLQIHTGHFKVKGMKRFQQNFMIAETIVYVCLSFGQFETLQRGVSCLSLVVPAGEILCYPQLLPSNLFAVHMVINHHQDAYHRHHDHHHERFNVIPSN